MKKTSKNFLQSTASIVLLSLGLSAVLAGFTVGAVVVETNEGSSQDQTLPAPQPQAPSDSGGGSGGYDLSSPSQFYPSYPGVAGPMLPTPPTYLDPNMLSPGLPTPPTGFAPYGSPQQQPTGSGLTGDPSTGIDPKMLPEGPISSGPAGGGSRGGGGGGGSPMMPSSPTQGQNLNQLGIADPYYGRFESARLEASLAPRQAAQVRAARNQVLTGGKPFSGYRQPSPYSPYMSLMRTQDSMRGIDNYYEYVMPQIQQEQTNKQVVREIGSLQSTARSGYQALQDIQQRPGSAPVQSGPITPATFMNTGGYYGPGR